MDKNILICRFKMSEALTRLNAVDHFRPTLLLLELLRVKLEFSVEIHQHL